MWLLDIRKKRRGRHSKRNYVYLKACPTCNWCGRHFTPYPLEPEDMLWDDCTQICKSCMELRRIYDIPVRPVFYATMKDDVI